jgi:hypothetical protein
LRIDIWLPIMEEEQPSSEKPSQPPLASSAPGAPSDQKPLKKRFEEHWLIFLLCFAVAVFLAGFGVKELLDARIKLEVTNTLKDMAKNGEIPKGEPGPPGEPGIPGTSGAPVGSFWCLRVNRPAMFQTVFYFVMEKFILLRTKNTKSFTGKSEIGSVGMQMCLLKCRI